MKQISYATLQTDQENGGCEDATACKPNPGSEEEQQMPDRWPNRLLNCVPIIRKKQGRPSLGDCRRTSMTRGEKTLALRRME